MNKLLLIAWMVCAAAIGSPAAETRTASSNTLAQPLPSTHVHNLFRATTNVFSGNSPDSAAAFAEIATLGVKTIISVDGARPDAEAARKYGMRYIHLPIGYDGVPSNRVVELVKAAQTVTGPIYVHCHHGKHRGPAAVAVICEATAGWTTNQAVAWLTEAGTATDYSGLYKSAMDFRLPEAAALGKIVELPEAAKTSSLVDAMVAIDEEMERLKSAQRNGWKGIPNQPDVVPAHTATILWEHLRELARIDDTAKRPEDYRTKLTASEKAAGQLRSLLRDANADTAARDTAFKSLGQTCAACHKPYRN
ncbi:MAG: cytochrome c [Verrucomicrobia bacterium]|nr:cytochrome c [Verrucomicrobiota bacterium]